MSVLKIKNKQGVWEEIQTINGKDGKDGIDGKDAKINGVNTLNILAGENIKLEQEGSDLTISAEGGTAGTTNYNELENRPLINDILLEGNINGRDLGILDEEDIDTIIDSKGFAKSTDIPDVSKFVTEEQVDEKLEGYVGTDKFDTLSEKVADIELFKFPNAIIHGTLTINNGQVSNFSRDNYLSLPAVFNLHDRGFEFNLAFRTGSDVTTAQNILGSRFCMALLIEGGKLKLRVSQNGSSWDLVDITGSIDIQPNTTYYTQIYFDKLTYKLRYSLDGITYTDIASKVASVSPNPAQIYLGVGNNFFNPFSGIMNLNKCNLKVNNSIVWQGMDDAGLSTRLATDMENIDEVGIEYINSLIDDKIGPINSQLAELTTLEESE